LHEIRSVDESNHLFSPDWHLRLPTFAALSSQILSQSPSIAVAPQQPAVAGMRRSSNSTLPLSSAARPSSALSQSTATAARASSLNASGGNSGGADSLARVQSSGSLRDSSGGLRRRSASIGETGSSTSSSSSSPAATSTDEADALLHANFTKMLPYMNGRFHLQEIMWRENLARKDVLDALTAFSHCVCTVMHEQRD
jgi:hypothetical protein